MTRRSQNGWAVDETGAGQDRTAVAGVTFPNGVRRGDVATVLLYVATRYHHEVEPLRAGTCWGWYVKGIEGSTAISNHASGTAIDLNADRHPLGVAGTHTPAQVAAIHRIVADCRHVVRWGGDYTGRKDPMHFEIVGTEGATAALAHDILEAPVTPAEIDAVATATVAKLLDYDLGKPGGNDTVAICLQSGYANTAAIREYLSKQPTTQTVAAAVAAALVPLLPAGALTLDQVTFACETAVKAVLRMGVDAP